jgi:hypothetical protein
MAESENNAIFYEVKPQEEITWDKEWAEDWQKVVEIYKTIEHLEHLFDQLDVSEFRKLTQRQMIINLQKYAYSLLKLIQEKYAE